MKPFSRLRDPALRRVLVNIIIVVVLATIQPAIWDWVSVSSQALHDQRTITGQRENLEEQLVLLRAEQESSQSIQDQLDAALIGSTEITQAVERLESKAQEKSVALRVHNIAAKEGDGEIDSLVITTTATGPINNILQYLEAVEHLAEVTVVKDLLLRPAPRPAAAVVFDEFSIDLNVAFAAEAAMREDRGEEATSRFTSIAIPPPPPQSFVSRLGNVLIFSSLAFVVALLVYRVMQSRKKE